MSTFARPAPPPASISGALLVGTSILSLALMLHHPSVATGAHGTSAAIAELARTGSLARVVHGGLIALLAVQAFAYVELAERLGWGRRVVRAAVVAYAAGFVAMIGATLISGFVVPRLADRYEASGTGDVEAVRAVLVACTAGNRTLAEFAAIAMSVAIALWSGALLDRSRTVAALGLLSGVVPAAALLTGALHLEVSGMTLVVLLQGVWNVAVGAALLRRRI
jgi:hypothetical protein